MTEPVKKARRTRRKPRSRPGDPLEVLRAAQVAVGAVVAVYKLAKPLVKKHLGKKKVKPQCKKEG